MRLDNLQCKAVNQGGKDEWAVFFGGFKSYAPTDVFPQRSSWMCLRLMLIAFFLSSMVNRHQYHHFENIVFLFPRHLCSKSKSRVNRNAPSAFQKKNCVWYEKTRGALL